MARKSNYGALRQFKWDVTMSRDVTEGRVLIKMDILNNADECLLYRKKWTRQSMRKYISCGVVLLAWPKEADHDYKDGCSVSPASEERVLVLSAGLLFSRRHFRFTSRGVFSG